MLMLCMHAGGGVWESSALSSSFYSKPKTTPQFCLKSIQGTTAGGHLHCNSAQFEYMMTEVSACIHKNTEI